MSDADYITPATQEQIARQVADAKKLNGNASLWDIENRRVVRTLANDRVRLTEYVRILREVANQIVLEDEQNQWAIPSDIVAGARAALKATK